MPDRILTSHAGSLPRPDDLTALNLERGRGELNDEAGFQKALGDSIVGVVKRQRDTGIDLVNDGEFGHSMGHRYDYGSWWTYVFQRLGGLELLEAGVLDIPQAPPKPGELALASFIERRDWQQFNDAYGDPSSGAALPNPDIGTGAPGVPRADHLHRPGGDRRPTSRNFKAALEAAGLEDGFLNSVAPGSCARFGNEFYDDDEELTVRVRGRDARGVQGDHRRRARCCSSTIRRSPRTGTRSTRSRASRTTSASRCCAIEALNHAIRDLPPERIRFHLCWGSWHGPHVTDIPMADIVDVMLQINAGSYSFEAANVRHEHEWRVWQDVKLPEGKVHRARRGQPLDERRRAPRAGRRPDRALRRGRRPRERRRRDRLRPGRARPPADRVGEARRPRRRAPTWPPSSSGARRARARTRSSAGKSDAVWDASMSREEVRRCPPR